MFRTTIVAAGSVLAILLFSQITFAVPSPSAKTFILNRADSDALMARIKLPAAQETYRGAAVVTKRFATSDRAIRIDCARQINLPAQSSPNVCSVTIDPVKAVAGITQVRAGYVANSSIFRIFAKQEVAAILANIVGSTGPYYTSEAVVFKDANGANVTVSRFVLSCPRDWVFDVVACEGHLINR